jgi:transcriptional regulator with XRE-family HTH domain
MKPKPKKTDMSFARALKGLRAARGMTQASLAGETGISVWSIRSWEKGSRCPVSPDFFSLLAFFGVGADEFAPGSP